MIAIIYLLGLLNGYWFAMLMKHSELDRLIREYKNKLKGSL